MKVRLTRKFANALNGVDLSRARQGDTLDLSPRDAGILLTEGWAEPADDPARSQAPDRPRRARQPKKSSKKR